MLLTVVGFFGIIVRVLERINRCVRSLSNGVALRLISKGFRQSMCFVVKEQAFLMRFTNETTKN
jgi:hypothetical protein